MPRDQWLNDKLKRSGQKEAYRLLQEQYAQNQLERSARKALKAKPPFRCPRCKAFNNRIREQQAKNGHVHIRCECANCGRFIRFLPQNH